VTIPQIFTRAWGPLAASAHEVGTAQVRVLIGCVFVDIVIESETCHICRAVLLTIQVAAHNSSGASKELALKYPSDQSFTHHNTAILDVGFLLSRGPEPV
jgi:hypothetical protein